uniref:Uncharacterized protein n=1 Tax=Tanacetum cinerariifolium TaxID=118510 RepID=A0A699KVW1_TANCI|nr:hypothetical protein [Tanacetum cinerariifolium]
METMNVSFDELLTMAFKQHSSKLWLQSMTSGKISSRLDLTYAPSTITTQQPTEGELDLLFKDIYDDFIGGQPSTAQRTVSAAQAQQVHQTIDNQRNKIMETMNVSFDELLTMAFKQHSSKLWLQSMTSGKISSRLDLTYAPSTITTQQPTEGELDLLFKDIYDDFIGGQPSTAQRTVSAAQAQQVHQTSTTSTSMVDSTPTTTNSSSHATNFPNTSQDVDEHNLQQQHFQQQENQAHL